MKRCSCCMELMGNSAVCSHCGYDNRRSQEIPYALPPGSVLQGKYLIGNVLGQGGFGITYIGFDMILEVKVAIKEYYISGNASRVGSQNQQVYWMSSPGDMNHFITEARRMAKLDKMSEIAHVRDIFYANQTAYIIMEYVEGVSLNKHLQRTGVMSYEQAVKLMMPVIEALGRVHEKGLVHRDISPDNLMLEPEGKLRVLDLGAAGDLTRNNAQATQMVARHGFSPYEQYLGEEKLGPYTDVYAVCATIYYCCTGKLIPDAMRRMEQYVRTRKSDLVLDSTIPPAAAKVLQKGLALEVKDRIPNMEILTEQLRKTLETARIKTEPSDLDKDVKSKVKKLGAQIDQKKNELASERGVQKQKEQSVPSVPMQEKKSETQPKQETAVPFKTVENNVQNLLVKYKTPLLAGVAALAVVICIAAFDGKDKAPKEQELKITATTSESTETVNTWDMQGVPTAEEVFSTDSETYSTEYPELPQEDEVPEMPEEGPEIPSSDENSLLPKTTQFKIKTGSTLAEAGLISFLDFSVYSDNFREMLQDNKTGISITGYEGELPSELVLPREIDGKLVTEIGPYAFRNSTNLTKVVIPDSVTYISWESFSGCESLTSIVLPSSLRVIAPGAFEGCINLTEVIIPEGMKEIYQSAFEGCKKITSVVIPDSVVKIDDDAFSGCTSLAEITIPESLSDIGGEAFYRTPWLNSQTDEFVICGDGVLLKYKGTASHVEIPSGVKNIAGAFCECVNLESVTIPQSVTNIGNSAFARCKNLTSVSIPESVKRIGAYAFNQCSSLVSVDGAEGVTSIGELAFYKCSNLANINIPEGMTLIGARAFHVCTSLKKVTIPTSMVELRQQAFADSGLTNVKILKGITEIGTSVFSGCESLESVDIPESVVTIQDRAFSGCKSLVNVNIPESVENIYGSAFEGCTSLKAVKIPKKVTTICVAAFRGCTSLTNVTIPETVINIQGAAFWECNLSEVTISKDCKYISGGGSVPTFPKSCKVNFY